MAAYQPHPSKEGLACFTFEPGQPGPELVWGLFTGHLPSA